MVPKLCYTTSPRKLRLTCIMRLITSPAILGPGWPCVIVADDFVYLNSFYSINKIALFLTHILSTSPLARLVATCVYRLWIKYYK